jgi:hypothetical protein
MKKQSLESSWSAKLLIHQIYHIIKQDLSQKDPTMKRMI